MDMTGVRLTELVEAVPAAAVSVPVESVAAEEAAGEQAPGDAEGVADEKTEE